jgi:hypothetical protein
VTSRKLLGFRFYAVQFMARHPPLVVFWISSQESQIFPDGGRTAIRIEKTVEFCLSMSRGPLLQRILPIVDSLPEDASER